MGCCISKQKDDDNKTHRRNAPSTVSYDFERQKDMQRALRDLGRREPIRVKPLDLSKVKLPEEPMKEGRKKQMGKKRDAFTKHKHHV